MTKALPYIFTSFGYGTWFFFASWMLLASTWAFFMLPETKGLTLAQMDIILYVKPKSLSNPLRKLFFSFSMELTLCFSHSGYNCEGHHGIPHTSVTTKLTKQDHDIAMAQDSKVMDADHAESV